MKKYIASLLWLSIIISSCKVTKDTLAPKPELPATFRNSSTTNTDTTSIGDLTWKQFFTDATLQQLIDSAILRNYDLQLATKNIEQANLLLRQSKWGYAPDVYAQAAASINRPSDNSLNGLSLKNFLGSSHIEDYTVALGVSWEADIWGKIRNNQKAALASYLQTNEAKKAVQTRLIADVSQGYFNLLMLDAQMQVAQKNLALNDSTLRIIRLQFNAGQVTALGIQQAEAQRATAAQLSPELQQYILVQENALSILTGSLPGKKDRNSALQDVPVPANLSAGYPAAILSRRTDVRSSELELDIANAQVGIAKANMYPALRITGNGGINAFKASNWFNIPASLFGTVAGSLTQPILQKKQLQTQYQIAQVERDKTVIRFRQTVLTAVGEVSDALAQQEQLNLRLQVAKSRVQTLQAAITNANHLFQNGLATYLEVITAQANLLQSELEVNAVKREQFSASIELYRALGGGWK
jgi:NodT family efflux transporter outer membrane factor (OMF) lipoprotein